MSRYKKKRKEKMYFTCSSQNRDLTDHPWVSGLMQHHCAFDSKQILSSCSTTANIIFKVIKKIWNVYCFKQCQRLVKCLEKRNWITQSKRQKRRGNPSLLAGTKSPGQFKPELPTAVTASFIWQLKLKLGLCGVGAFNGDIFPSENAVTAWQLLWHPRFKAHFCDVPLEM